MCLFYDSELNSCLWPSFQRTLHKVFEKSTNKINWESRRHQSFTTTQWLRGVTRHPLIDSMRIQPLGSIKRAQGWTWGGDRDTLFLARVRDGADQWHLSVLRLNDGDADANTGLFGTILVSDREIVGCDGMFGDCVSGLTHLPTDQDTQKTPKFEALAVSQLPMTPEDFMWEGVYTSKTNTLEAMSFGWLCTLRSCPSFEYSYEHLRMCRQAMSALLTVLMKRLSISGRPFLPPDICKYIAAFGPASLPLFSSDAWRFQQR